MAADLSNTVPQNLATTLGALLAKDTTLKACTKVDIRDLQGNELLRVDVEFVFDKITSHFSYFIPATSASRIFNTMMAATDHEIVSKIDDDIKDAMEEFISNTCGGLVTTINAENFEELGQAKFNIRHKEIVDGNQIEDIENNFRFLIDIDGEEVVIFTKFEENFLAFIQELTNAETTYHPEEVIKKEEVEEEEEVAPIPLENEKQEEIAKEPSNDDELKKKKMKKMIIIGASTLFALIILIFIVLIFSSPEEKPIEEKIVETNTTAPLTKTVEMVQYEPEKKIDFKTSDIDVERLNNKLELLTKYQVLTQEELEFQAKQEKERIVALKKEQALIEFAKGNKEEPLAPNMIERSKLIQNENEMINQNSVTASENPKQKITSEIETIQNSEELTVSTQVIKAEEVIADPIEDRLKFIFVDSIKYTLFKDIVKQLNSKSARISICSDTYGKTQIYIGPFENEELQIQMNTLIREKDSAIQTVITNISQDEFDTRCSFE